MASLILGSTGLLFGAAITLLGAALAASRDRGRAFACSLVLLASIVPHVVSIVAVPALTHGIGRTPFLISFRWPC